ncbi:MULTISPECIES: hypothetical protein [Pseudoalteromonas]|uniref:Membrane protein n=1 Tax=Pseudoalteromonas fuliginea TaxID=1872678 RepID=A0ABD3Y7P3_9GAMM|nr:MULTISPECIES: hypothetical protein [Pseudoalteromonas]ALQ09056.1 hypothetical protein D172_013935 [Pseudoalteromonas sp. Bsw20308]KAA1155767.1 hypothetical protein EU509_11665 [Pseudoalteromonas fuliginea]KAA1167056.1 hypothetical protein EUZ79_11530 [Pseudoalteromonas fuliginea]KDC49885.1 membrane protein [Pseudoalteromonas fuliginea]MDQ2045475.1 hypothetical protein [Pseudoalteromonas sp. 20-92]
MNELLISPTVSLYIGAFVQWGFLMAFLYSLAHSINKPNKEKVYLSLVMSVSYSFSIFTNMNTVTYLDFLCFDILTIIALTLLRRFLKRDVAYIYLLTGLTINSTLHLFMHYDIYVLDNVDYWWLWNFYLIVINLVDLTMVTILFFNKDFLGLVKFTKFLTEKFNRSRHA